MSVLDEKVLLLNRNMVALRLVSVRRAFFLLAKPRRKTPSEKVATVLDVDANHDIIGPVKWDEWITREPADGDRYVATTSRRIKVPSIIILSEYDKVPVVDPILNKSSLWERQKGKDMYTLEPLTWHDCDMDHFVPRSKGGKTSWTNCGLTAIANNRKKGDRRAEDVGLKLQIPLSPPKPKPLFVRLKRDPRFPEWDFFIKD